MLIRFLLIQFLQYLAELCSHAGIHTVGIVLEDKTADDRWVNLGVELYCTMCFVLYHLPHFLLYLGSDGSGSDKCAARDILLFKIERYIRRGHKLKDILAVLFKHKLEKDRDKMR